MGRSDFLFPDASFAEGAGSAFDLLGSLAQYNAASDAAEADVRALRADWSAVGDYLWLALLRASKEANERPTQRRIASQS